MEPGLTLTLSSEALIGPVSILKNGKMSTLMKIEPVILENFISDIFKCYSCHGSQRKERSYMFMLEGTTELGLVIAEYYQS
jgi:hypothetical protein